MEIIWPTLFILVVLTIALGLIYPAYAFQVELIPWYWEEKPLVCFVSSDDYFMASAFGIGLWNTAFNGTWGHSSLIENRYENATHQHESCNVYVYHLEKVWSWQLDSNGDKIYERVMGVTWCDKDNAIKGVCYAYIATHNIGNGKERSNREILTTTTHELGHIWGLGHVIPENSKEIRHFPFGFTIMSAYPQYQDLGIHDDLVSAIKCRYPEGIGGWIDFDCRNYFINWDVI